MVATLQLMRHAMCYKRHVCKQFSVVQLTMLAVAGAVILLLVLMLVQQGNVEVQPANQQQNKKNHLFTRQSEKTRQSVTVTSGPPTITISSPAAVCATGNALYMGETVDYPVTSTTGI